jgi:hypothetical protein
MTQRLLHSDVEAGGHPVPEILCFESWWEEGGARVFANVDYHVASQECVARYCCSHTAPAAQRLCGAVHNCACCAILGCWLHVYPRNCSGKSAFAGTGYLCASARSAYLHVCWLAAVPLPGCMSACLHFCMSAWLLGWVCSTRMTAYLPCRMEFPITVKLTRRGGDPLEIWDLHVGAQLTILGRKLILKKVCPPAHQLPCLHQQQCSASAADINSIKYCTTLPPTATAPSLCTGQSRGTHIE